MQRVTVKNNLSIQFDLDQITSGDVQDQIQQAINQINGVLQREPMGLGASIMLNYGPTTELEYDVEDFGPEEEA